MVNTLTDQELIEECLKGSLRRQRELYESYAPKMMGLCMRYAASEEEAEDILQEGFVKVFRKLDTYNGQGDLGAWIRKVILNTALMNYRKEKKFQMNTEFGEVSYMMESGEDLFGRMSARDLMQMIQDLPAGYRVIFNLYAIEGYNHREIGEKLEISEGTSKSQYSRARALLRKMIENEEEKVRGRAI